MDFMDLLLADAIAAGMARQAAEARQRPPPDNFFILPPDPQAWRKLYSACKAEHMVICVEVTDDSHAGCRRSQPMFVDLAREISQIPFFRVKIGFGRTYDELRQDLGGIRFVPTIIVVFFDDDDVLTKKVEGEDDIKLALATGAVHRVIKEYIDQKQKLKLVENLAEHLFKGMAASEAEKRKREEYERKLAIEREEMERKELEMQLKEREKKRLDEEKERRLEAERRDEEELQRRRQALEDKRSRVEDELLRMDLSNCKIRDIKDKMEEASIGYVGATSREDLLAKLKNKLPRLKAKLENSSIGQQSSGNLSGYNIGTRRTSSINETDGPSSREDVSRLKQKVEQLEGVIEEYEQRRECLNDENDSLKRDLRNKDRELSELKINQRRTSGGLFGSSSNSRVSALEEELLETRMLYSCTLDDMDILGVIARGDARGQGTVVRVKCSKFGLPNPNRVFAMKVISQVLETTTYSMVRNEFKTEYEILSALPQHKNIIKLFAFFYDRPRTHPKLQNCGDGMALCILMEQLSQNMEEYISIMRRGSGLSASKVIGWLKDVVAGSQFLFSNCVVHRDMKLANLLLSGDTIKIADFGSAIRLDSTMRLSFIHVSPRGGNEAHLAPEILNARPSVGKFLDYNKQPVWEAGVLAYELAGHRSPFERTSIDQRSYRILSLPNLGSTYAQSSDRQQAFPPGFTRLVQSMLEFDADNRPTLDDLQKQLSRF